MNFDNLKDAWAKEPVTGTIPEPMTGKTRSAVTRLRGNMRNEFVWTLIGLACTLVFMMLWGGGHLSVLTFCTAALLFSQSGYYFFRFFLYYRRTGSYDLGLRKGLRRFVSELELNMEIYRTYSFCVTPVACLLWIAILDKDGSTHLIRQYMFSDAPASPWRLLEIIIVLIGIQATVAFCLQFHLRTQYGRYLKELKKILEDLEEDPI